MGFLANSSNLGRAFAAEVVASRYGRSHYFSLLCGHAQLTEQLHQVLAVHGTKPKRLKLKPEESKSDAPQK